MFSYLTSFVYNTEEDIPLRDEKEPFQFNTKITKKIPNSYDWSPKEWNQQITNFVKEKCCCMIEEFDSIYKIRSVHSESLKQRSIQVVYTKITTGNNLNIPPEPITTKHTITVVSSIDDNDMFTINVKKSTFGSYNE